MCLSFRTPFGEGFRHLFYGVFVSRKGLSGCEVDMCVVCVYGLYSKLYRTGEVRCYVGSGEKLQGSARKESFVIRDVRAG